MEKVEYGFEYELSEGLPSSFNSKYGRITYFVKAILEGSEAETKEVTVREFIINGHVDLNDIPDASKPVELNLTQELLFGNGQLGMELKLSKGGFISGEKIHVDSQFVNKSEEKSVNVYLYLIKVTSRAFICQIV